LNDFKLLHLAGPGCVGSRGHPGTFYVLLSAVYSITGKDPHLMDSFARAACSMCP